MHASRDHGYRKKVRFFAAGDTCQACGQLFHSGNRLSIHLEENLRCYDVIQSCWPPMPLALVQELDAADAAVEAKLRQEGWWASKAFQPALATCFVPLPPAESPEARLLHDKMTARRPSDELPFLNMQGRRIEQTPPSSKDLWWTRDDMPAFVFQSPQGTDRGHGAYDMHGLAREAARLHIRSLVIVHFSVVFDALATFMRLLTIMFNAQEPTFSQSPLISACSGNMQILPQLQPPDGGQPVCMLARWFQRAVAHRAKLLLLHANKMMMDPDP